MEIELENETPEYMKLPKLFFTLRFPEHKGDAELSKQLLEGITANNMAPYYLEVCAELGWTVDGPLLASMEEANRAQLAQYDLQDTEDAGSATGSTVEEHESQVTWHEKLLYLCSIGDREAAVALATAKSRDASLSPNRRLDAAFALYRIALFHGCDVRKMRNALDVASQTLEASSGGGDWSARNKFKAYDAVYCLAVRDYARAAPLFLDAVPTFESAELVSFRDYFRYAVLAAMIALPRQELHARLMKPGVIPQSLNEHAPELRDFFVSLYDGQYADFFHQLAAVEQIMKRDPVLQPHYRHYIREMRLRAYAQLLCAYRSLSLESMAEAFGVSEDMIEREVARFTASGRLRCKIDHVGRRVLTEEQGAASVPYPRRTELYQGVIKKGDSLLNRLEHLSRILNV